MPALVLSLLVSFVAWSTEAANPSYYGPEFSTTISKKSVSKMFFHKILNEYHHVQGKYDQIANQCQGSCYRHSSIGYEGARKIMFTELDVQQDTKGKFVEDVYCGKKFYYKSVDEVSNRHSEFNIEHTWPQSKFNRSYDKNMQKSDLHHLFPTDSDANNRRANHDFGEVQDNHDELNVQNCDISRLSDISGHFIFSPPAHHKGNVARALFYFSTRYNLPIEPAAEMILRLWHKNDPVDAKELRRHDIIVKYQKVRNPFIDYPELVEKVSDF